MYRDASGNMAFTNAPPHSQCKFIAGKRKKAEGPKIRSTRYDPVIEKIALNYGLDPALVQAVIKVESNFNPSAVSPKGAIGLMQLLPATARRFGVTDCYDPVENITGGIRYLKYLLMLFNGNLDLSLAAYNAGENVVLRLGRIPPYRETQNYVRKIKTLYRGSGRV